MAEPTSEPSATPPVPEGAARLSGTGAAGGEPVGRPRTAVLSATVAVVALVGGWTWAAAVQPGGFDSGAESISALAASTTPHRWIMTTALVITGLSHLVTAWALVPARRTGRLLLAAGGLATLAVAGLPLPSRTDSSAAHTVVATASFALLAAWPWFAARPDGPVALERRVGRPAAVVMGVAVASLGIGLGGDAFGVHERVVAGLTVGWPLVAAASTWWWAGHRVATRRVRHGLAVVGLVAACALAGTSATAVAPATAQTRHYQASVSLDPNPLRSSELVATTAFGDLRLEFQGLAPGIRAVPQVKANIAEVLSRPGVSLASLRPGPEELSAAIRDVAVSVMVRFSLGALAVVVLTLAGYAVLRRRRPPTALIVAGLVGWVVSTAVTAVALYATYQPDRQETFTSTGVLGTLQRNQGILSDVETRATQVAPYLRNLIALSTALQQKYQAAPLESDTSLRVLLVSDIHAGNQYDLMRTIVQEEGVDLVVDAGDLINFGTVEEADATGLFTGIASLDVPYLFVRGNHDANSATDTALLERLDRIPDVVLLEGASGNYTEVTVHGVRIAGFNDPRWFGDSGTGSRAKQEPAREAFTAAYAGRPAPDLVVGHEPWAVEGLAGGVLVNGHMHSADLEGNRVQAGTFTGGGPFTHFLADSGGEELVGQPSAFDVLTFGTDCRLATLSRYRFRDVIEGRPAYDDVSLVNGRRIDRREADPARTCSVDAPLTTLAVPRAAVAAAAAGSLPAAASTPASP
jgi:predicted phosphodiesterase/ABC-type glycerol-3-phosphate transport system permease component